MGSVGGGKGGTLGGWAGWGEITWGEMPDVDDRRMEATNHTATCVRMQQSYIICTCTPEPKVQLKKKKKTTDTGSYFRGTVVGGEK